MFSPNCVVALLAPEMAIKSSAVRVFMQQRLKKNVLLCLKNNGLKPERIVFLWGRFLIFSKTPVQVIEILKKCFGVHALYLAEERIFSSFEELENISVDVCSGRLEDGSFAVRGKSFVKDFSSKRLEEELGAALLRAFPKLKVNLGSPQKELFCVVDKNKVVLFFERVLAAQGMPVSSQGKAALLVDGYYKKDLVELGLFLLKSGCSLLLVGSKAIELKELFEWNSFQKVKFVPIEVAKEYYSHEGIRAFFSPARTVKQAEQDSVLVGVKCFAPNLF
jgi:hypothetical protein